MVKGFTFLQTMLHNPKLKNPLLAVVWSIGLILGIHLAATASNTLIPFMHRATHCSASIFGLLVAMVTPFLISFCLHHLYKPLLFLVCFIKAVSYGFCSYGLFLTYGYASWLVHFFFLFSDIFVVPMLLFFWSYCVRDNTAYIFHILGICIVFTILIVLLDAFYVSPFWLKVVSGIS